jgi:hypothetical protein
LEISPAWTGVPIKAQETIPSSANANSFFIIFKVNPLQMLSGDIFYTGSGEGVQLFREGVMAGVPHNRILLFPFCIEQQAGRGTRCSQAKPIHLVGPDAIEGISMVRRQIVLEIGGESDGLKRLQGLPAI